MALLFSHRTGWHLLLHSGVMRLLLREWIPYLLFLPALLLAVPLYAENTDGDSIHIHMDETVIYCSAGINMGEKQFALSMGDGISMTTAWHIQVREVRKYWLNKGIADITVRRKVEPDLLTRSWLLSDASSGITRRVYNIADAMKFLTRLENLPVLDRSLLLPGKPYRASVSVDVQVGNMKDAWWARLWHGPARSMQEDFLLP